MIDIDQLVAQANKEILDRMDKFDKIKTAYEEELDREIIHEEINLKDKVEDHLRVAAHVINLVFAANPEKLLSFRQASRIVFGAFRYDGKAALLMVMPVIEFISSGQKPEKDETDKLKTLVYERTLSWLKEELDFLKNKPELLEQLVKDVQKYG